MLSPDNRIYPYKLPPILSPEVVRSVPLTFEIHLLTSVCHCSLLYRCSLTKRECIL